LVIFWKRLFAIFVSLLNKQEERRQQMKQWIAGHIFSTDDLFIEDDFPISDKELYISLSMVIAALAAFAVLIHVLGT
jgi:hypothetical protein